MNKIVFICNNWIRDTGGGRRVVALLLNNLAMRQKQFEFTLIDLEIGEEKENFPEIESGLDKGIKFIPVFQPRAIKTIFPLSRILRRENPRLIVNTSGPNVKALSFFTAKIFVPKAKIILIDHSPVQSIIPILKHPLINKVLIVLAYKYVDKVVGVSKELSEQTKKYFNLKNDQVIFIYNPFDLATITQKSTEEVKHPWFREKKDPIIISVARLDPIQKDFPTLLKAFTLINKKVSTRLVILGSGPQEQELKKLADELDITQKVWFVGFQENPYKFMALADIFILSSKFEALPAVLVEAMACGVPVISSDCDFGPREILENGKYGVLVPVRDVAKMSEAILRLLRNKELCQQFIESGKKKVLEFTVEGSVKEYEKIFNQVLSS